MSLALNGSSALQHFEHGKEGENVMFDFYTWDCHMTCMFVVHCVDRSQSVALYHICYRYVRGIITSQGLYLRCSAADV